MNPDVEFKLLPYTDGAPAPVAITLADTFLLASRNFRCMDVLKAHVMAAVAPAAKYFQDRFHKKRCNQMARIEAARFLNQLYIKATFATKDHLDAIKHRFKMAAKPSVREVLDKAESELDSYNKAVGEIPSKGERLVRDNKGDKIDPFCIRDWWRSRRRDLPNLVKLYTKVICHAANSCPPERVFSILGDSFDKEQKNALLDYIELSLMLQFNRSQPGTTVVKKLN